MSQFTHFQCDNSIIFDCFNIFESSKGCVSTYRLNKTSFGPFYGINSVFLRCKYMIFTFGLSQVKKSENFFFKNVGKSVIFVQCIVRQGVLTSFKVDCTTQEDVRVKTFEIFQKKTAKICFEEDVSNHPFLVRKFNDF